MMEMGLKQWSKRGFVLPFVGMIVAMAVQVSTMEITKIALAQGVNKLVFLVYSNAVSTLVLLPSSLITHRSDTAPLSFSIICGIFFLSLISLGIHISAYTGLQYGSATLGTAMLNLIPAFTFILAIIFRLEKVEWKSKSGIAKCLGTIISISGAFVVIFAKGASVFTNLNSSQLLWIIGGFFFVARAFLDSSAYILQVFILRKFPAVLLLTCVHFFFNAILSGLFTFVVVKDTRAWELRLNMGLFAICYEGVVGYAFRISLIVWCLSKTGPLYVSMFKPLAVVFAVIADALFLGDAITLGSLIGGSIAVIGFYTVLWGKAKEKKTSEKNVDESCERAPLLQNRTEQV